MRIILASTSENRRALLDRMGFEYEVFHPDYEEVIEKNKPPESQVMEFALGKAKSIYHQFENLDDVLILGFDSMINFEGTSQGKPLDKKDAFEMIKKFTGKDQRVVSGIAVVGKVKGKYFEKIESESTDVTFRSDITDEEIEKYLEFGDWKGKCGSYSILGTGFFFLEKIQGDFQNIVGVPVFSMGKLIREITGKAPAMVMSLRKL